ncbi:carbohydrate ABC transporter permease [Niallia sp. JL1B1071]|uniref:carbohydrate ABC transporter permease n=1 Tax=Niallia tiangongensis TaxID=3237105 RepID=UPI0037DC8FB9
MQNKLYSYKFIFPALFIFTALYTVPTVASFIFSFTDWNMYKEGISFVGIEPIKTVLEDPVFRKAIVNIFIYAFITTVLQNVIGLGIALIFNRGLKTKSLLQTMFFLPTILSALVIGITFGVLMHPTEGLFNNLLGSIGLDALALNWLSDPAIAMYSITGINIWQYVGFSMVIYIAALQSVPNHLYEAARIDGANKWVQFKSITLPMIGQGVTINIMLALIGSFKVFDTVYVLTGGGPGNATEVINTYVYREMAMGRYNTGSAGSLILFVIVTVISVLFLKFLRRNEVEA